MSDTEKFLVDSLVEDVQKLPPKLVIIETGKYKQGFGGRDFDFLAYLSRDSRFAHFWERYAFLMEVPNYQVYVRR